MKFGYRTPSLIKSIGARTSGNLKRNTKHLIDPFYGRKGIGWVKDPQRATYNKTYRQTSWSLFDIFK